MHTDTHSKTDNNDGRREVASRNTKWADKIARKLLQWNISPNSISIMSVIFSLIGGSFILILPYYPSLYYTSFIAYIICIQLRLLCNLFDGMVAVEGGKKSENGDLYNDIPDRLSDIFFIVPVGYFAGGFAIELAWIATLLAILTAYLRWLGVYKTSKHFFEGPMAKQHRMALLTLMAILLLFLKSYSFYVISASLIVMCLGLIVTLIRRLYLISRPLS